MELRAGLLVLVCVCLPGCALFPLSEADCRPPSWRQRGYDDGFGGSYPQDLRLIPECRSRYGAEVSQAEYLEGWRDGHLEWERLNESMGRRHR
jgi:hypothetical protein